MSPELVPPRGGSSQAAPDTAPLGRLRRGVGAVRRIVATTRAKARPPMPIDTAPHRGMAFAGTIWLGGSAEPEPGVLVLDAAGRVAELRQSREGLPADLPVHGSAEHWV